jgi:hypothetical protein
MIHFPSLYLLHSPTVYLLSKLTFPEGWAGTTREPPEPDIFLFPPLKCGISSYSPASVSILTLFSFFKVLMVSVLVT